VHPLIQRYLDALSAEHRRSALTLRNYLTDLRAFDEYLRSTGRCDLKSVDRVTFRGYLASLAERGVARGSVARIVSTIHTFYRHLLVLGSLSRDPLAGVRPPKRERRLPRVLAEEEAVALVSSPIPDDAFGLRDRAILELLYASGVRVAEIVSLNVEAIDLDEARMVVRGKGKKERVALFGNPAAEAIARYLYTGRPALTGKRGEPALFLNRDGGRLSARADPDHRQAGRDCLGNRRRYPPAHAQAFVRNAFVGWRCRSARRPGTLGPCECQHHANLHTRYREPATAGVRRGLLQRMALR